MELGSGKGSFCFYWRIEAPRKDAPQRLAPAPEVPAAEAIDDAALLGK